MIAVPFFHKLFECLSNLLLWCFATDFEYFIRIAKPSFGAYGILANQNNQHKNKNSLEYIIKAHFQPPTIPPHTKSIDTDILSTTALRNSLFVPFLCGVQIVSSALFQFCHIHRVSIYIPSCLLFAYIFTYFSLIYHLFARTFIYCQ